MLRVEPGWNREGKRSTKQATATTLIQQSPSFTGPLGVALTQHVLCKGQNVLVPVNSSVCGRETKERKLELERWLSG